MLGNSKVLDSFPCSAWECIQELIISNICIPTEMVGTSEADKFLELANSLSRYRRAELKDENEENLIEKLYE